MDKLAFDRRVQSDVIYRKKCLFWGAVLESNGSNVSYVDIYNGENATEPRVMRIRTPKDQSASKMFNPPIFLPRGLYVDFGTNLTAVTVFATPVE